MNENEVLNEETTENELDLETILKEEIDNQEELKEVEEVVEEKVSFFKKLKDPKYSKYKIIAILLLMCTIGGLGYYVTNSMNWSAQKTCKEFIEGHPNLTLVTLEGQDPNISYFDDSVIKQEGVTYTGMFEVFNNKTEALLKKDYYELYDKKMAEYFNEANLGKEFNKLYGTGKWTVYVNGNTLIRLSHLYTTYQTEQLIKQFNQTMDRVYQSEKNIPTKDQQNTIKKNYEKQVTNDVKTKKDELLSSIEGTLVTLKALAEKEDTTIDRLLEIKEEAATFKVLADLSLKALEIEEIVNKRIQSQIDNVNTILDDAQNNYSRDKVQEAKDAIALLTHDIFKEHKDPWSTRIEEILYQIQEKEIQDYKDQCTEYNYYDIDSSYEGSYAYFYGRIMSVSTNNEGRIALVVNVTPQYLFGNIAYWSNSVYVDVDNDIALSFGQGDLIQLWGELEGMITNEQVFGDDKTYPSLYCKYASL